MGGSIVEVSGFGGTGGLVCFDVAFEVEGVYHALRQLFFFSRLRQLLILDELLHIQPKFVRTLIISRILYLILSYIVLSQQLILRLIQCLHRW